MAIDALAYIKALEAAAVERLEQRLTLRLITIVGAFNTAVFAPLRFVH